MKVWVAILLLLSIPGSGIKTVSRINDYAERAAKAYNREQYAEAITAYEILLNDLEVQDDQLRLNLAHAYYNAGLLNQARDQYRLLADHTSEHIRSVVHVQLGNIAGTHKKYLQALAMYRNALLANPRNEVARYNYELLKKYLALHPEKAAQDKPEPQPQEDDQLPPPAFDDQQPKPKQNPDANGDQEAEVDTPQPDPAGQPQNQGGSDQKPQNRQQEQAAGNESGKTKGQQFDEQQTQQPNERTGNNNAAAGDTRARTESNYRQMNISPEKARMLLNAMRDAELQYLQQLPKKAKSKPDHTKPDW